MFRLILPLILSLIFNPLTLVSQEREGKTQDLPKSLEFSDYQKFKAPKGIESLCEPEYSSGCDMGDGFTDFAVEEIENYGSGCDDLNGTGWSQYLEMGPAILYPGLSHDFVMQTGYADQFVTIWVDFNDDEDLTSDEIILFDFEMEEVGQFYTASVAIPEDATPGLHYMRARTNWQATCDDPCASYSYGEAEDYYVLIGSAESGTVEGWVTELGTANPVEDAFITLEGVISYSVNTTSDGYYFIDYVFAGDYELTCAKPGYNSQSAMVTIEDEMQLEMDFQLTHPEINVDPLSITLDVPVNGTTQESVLVENSGNGPLDWAASIQIVGDSKKSQFDLQYQYPVAEGNGEAGIETDGNYIYTVKWNTGDILKYDLSGTYIETLDISIAARDLAYNGTYFYGGAATTTVYEMDFENEIIVSSFTAPTMVRAIAYNEGEDVFYANNYSSSIVKFDMMGANLGEFDCGPVGENYYGFAYDPASAGGPFLWGYAQTGESLNEIVQIQLPSGTETGLTLDVKDKLSGPVFNMAGGLFSQPNMIFGKWTLGGLVQNEWLWGLELADAQTWIWIDPNAGNLDPDNSVEPVIHIDVEDMTPGTYTAEILFTSYPDVGSPVIDVTINIGELIFVPCDITSNVNCTDVELSWSVCPAGSPDADSFYIYRDDELLGSAYEPEYVDIMANPETPLVYKISAFFDGQESIPSDEAELTVPLPENLEPTDLQLTFSGNDVILVFNPPEACLEPQQYNLYRDGQFLTSGSDPEFLVTGGYYTYYVTALYYFGESMPSNEVIFTGISENLAGNIQIYPNPASQQISINSKLSVERIVLMDLLGNIILTDTPDVFPYNIVVSGIPAGVYFVHVITDHGSVTEKVLIQ